MDSTTPISHPPASPGSIALRLSLRPVRLVIALVVFTVMLSAISLVANIMWAEQIRGAQTAIELFSVDKESSLPTWWAGMLLAAVGGLTWLVSRSRKSACLTEKLAWWILAAGFVFLSIDECCMLHERLGSKIKLEGSFHHARWILLWLPPAILVAGVVLWRLWRASRRLVLGIILGVVVFLGGAVGAEMFNASYRYQQETSVRQEAQAALDAGETNVTRRDWRIGSTYYPYTFGTVIEEFLEALGPIIWIAALLNFYREQTADTQPDTAP